MDGDGRAAIDYRFRLLYALGMIFIVAGHAEGGGVSLFYDWFAPYAFHIGLFVFCSGYFFKDESAEDLPRYCLKKARTLLLPMLLWNFFYAALVLLSRRFGFTIGLDVSFETLFLMPLYEGSQFEYNMGAWFVVPLFCVQMLTALLRRLLRPSRSAARETGAFLLWLGLGGLGVFLAQRGFVRAWELIVTRTLLFFPYFGMGVFYRRVLERYDRLDNGPYFLLVFAVQYALIVALGRIPSYFYAQGYGFTDGLLTPFLAGFAGIAFWLRMAKLLEPSLGRDKWLNAIADSSYSIMVNQYLGFMLVKAGFALIQAVTGRFADFSMAEFKSNLAYFYAPSGPVFYLVYLAAGLAVPIAMQKLVNLTGRLTKRRL